MAIAAWGLHVGALSLAALSIVQAVLSGRLVFLAVLAERFFGFRLGRRQWVGLTITATGLVVIGLTSGGADDTQRASLAALIAIEGAIFVVVAALVRISTRRYLPNRGEGLLLGAAASALWGVSDIAIKYLTQASPGPVLGLVSPCTLTALIAGVIAFYASARSLQIGDGVEVIALTSVTANLTAIIGGDPCLPRPDRLRRCRDHRPLPRVLPGDRRCSSHARPDARHPRCDLALRTARPAGSCGHDGRFVARRHARRARTARPGLPNPNSERPPSPFFGQLTDRFGRKKLFLLTLVVYLIATVATAFSGSALFFYVCRFHRRRHRRRVRGDQLGDRRADSRARARARGPSSSMGRIGSARASGARAASRRHCARVESGRARRISRNRFGPAS